MTRWVSVGQVGRLHGRDGSFYVERADHPLAAGTAVRVGERDLRIARRGGTDARPLVRLEGVEDRGAAAALQGEPLLVPESESPLGADEWLAGDLVGCEVPGLGRVRGVLAAPSCDVLEVGEEPVLVPLVRDAVRSVDLERRVIDVDVAFVRGVEVDPSGERGG